jgi:hypothetical protein
MQEGRKGTQPVAASSGFVGILPDKLNAAGGELIDFGTRQTCLSEFGHVDGSYTKKPPSRRYTGSRTGRAGGICRVPFSPV